MSSLLTKPLVQHHLSRVGPIQLRDFPLDCMILNMVGKFAPNSTQFTKGLVKYIPGRGCFCAVLSLNGDKFATYPEVGISFVDPLMNAVFIALFVQRGASYYRGSSGVLPFVSHRASFLTGMVNQCSSNQHYASDTVLSVLYRTCLQ